MNKETIEGLESIDKEYARKATMSDDCDYKFEDKRTAIRTAIQALKALDCAEKVLGEKNKPLPKMTAHKNGVLEGFNELHDIAQPILANVILDRDNLNKRLHILADDYAKAQLKISHLETELERMKGFINNHPNSKELQEKDKRISELEETIKDKSHFISDLIETAGDFELERDKLKQELSQLKAKLSRNNINKITAKAMEDYSVEDYEVRGDDGDYSPNEHERFLILDYSIGLVDEIDEAIQKELGVERCVVNAKPVKSNIK